MHANEDKERVQFLKTLNLKQRNFIARARNEEIATSNKLENDFKRSKQSDFRMINFSKEYSRVKEKFIRENQTPAERLFGYSPLVRLFKLFADKIFPDEVSSVGKDFANDINNFKFSSSFNLKEDLVRLGDCFDLLASSGSDEFLKDWAKRDHLLNLLRRSDIREYHNLAKQVKVNEAITETYSSLCEFIVDNSSIYDDFQIKGSRKAEEDVKNEATKRSKPTPSSTSSSSHGKGGKFLERGERLAPGF